MQHRMKTLRERDAILELLWKQFEDVPMNPETEKIEAPFLHLPMNDEDYLVYFDIGTPRDDIWHWFDERHSKGVAYLLYGRQFYEKGPDEVYPLREFINQEVPFRLKEIFCIPEDLLTPSVVDDIVWSLYDDSDVMFDYDSMDEFISKRLKRFDIDPDDYKEDEDE